MNTQVIVMISTLAALVALGFLFNRSIKKYDAEKSKVKKKKGRSKYMPEVKNKFK